MPFAIAQEADPTSQPSSREVPVSSEAKEAQDVMNRVNSLTNQLTGLGTQLKSGLPPDQLHETVQKINQALTNASKMLSPRSGINETEQRVAAKLADAMEQLKDASARIEQGQGSIGMMLKDPELGQELKEVATKFQKLMSHKHELRFVIDIGAEEVVGYSEGTSRAYFNLGIWPTEDYYYLFGFADDPRGKVTIVHTTVIGPSGNATSTDTYKVDETGFVFTGMVGKQFFRKRLDLSAGFLYGDLDMSAAGNLGPRDLEDRLKLRVDFYSHSIGEPLNERITLILRPWPVVYGVGGVDGVRRVGGTVPWLYGVGITFDDADIRYLFNTYLANAF
ncbi:MAG: hypothetical protein P4M08_07150 [Oligoflexia bacterium]|nr:hypothetical protein [Oligoflexia bacterium]